MSRIKIISDIKIARARKTKHQTSRLFSPQKARAKNKPTALSRLGLADLSLLLDLVKVDAGNLSLVTVDDLGELLQGGALGLDIHEVDKGKLEEDPAGVDEVELPGAVGGAEEVEGDGVGVDVEGESALDGQVHDHETLGAELVGEDLDGVADEETGPGERVHDAEDPDEEDHGLVGTGGLLGVPESRADGPEDKGAEHATGGGQEHGAATDLVDKHGHGDGDDEGKAGLAGTETELGSLVGDTGRVVELGGVVGDDSVTRPLGEDTEGDEDGESVAVALGAEEIGVAGVALGLVLETDGLLDLLVLELDGGVLVVAVGVVLGEHGKSLVVLVLGNEETGGLGDPVDEGKLDERGESLEKGGHTPRPLGGDVGGAEGEPGDDQGTDVPQAVVDAGKTATMLGMADFGEKHGRRDLGEGVAETEEDTATHEDTDVGARTLDDGTDNHDNAANGDGELATKVIGEERAVDTGQVSNR